MMKILLGVAIHDHVVERLCHTISGRFALTATGSWCKMYDIPCMGVWGCIIS